MSMLISLCNGAAVSIFGSILSASFCGALENRRNRWIFAGSVAAMLLFHGILYFLLDPVFLREIYPLIAHLPLLVILWVLTKKWLWPLICILSAYLCCQLRRWLAMLVVVLFSGGTQLQDCLELAITVPLLLFLLHFAAPVFRELSDHSIKVQWRFGIIPMVYYVFDYLTRIYTELLSSGSPVAVEFMSFVCCGAYLIFLVYNSVEEQKENRLLQAQNMLNLQLDQALQHIDDLKESQDLARRYRHDLRHHLQYLSACMENGQQEQAREYIRSICEEIDTRKIHRYCENEAANLILSAFVSRARKENIEIKVGGSLPAVLLVSDKDLCVLLSNALENALHGCQLLTAAGKECVVDVQFHEREGKLFLQIINPCEEEVKFKNGIPVSHRPGHGIGVQSICAIVERYGGAYTFLVEEKQFILRLFV